MDGSGHEAVEVEAPDDPDEEADEKAGAEHEEPRRLVGRVARLEGLVRIHGLVDLVADVEDGVLRIEAHLHRRLGAIVGQLLLKGEGDRDLVPREYLLARHEAIEGGLLRYGPHEGRDEDVEVAQVGMPGFALGAQPGFGPRDVYPVLEVVMGIDSRAHDVGRYLVEGVERADSPAVVAVAEPAPSLLRARRVVLAHRSSEGE